MLRKLRQLNVRSSLLARNTGWMAFGLGGNALLQAGAFLLLARLLGVKEYGAFAGVFALVNTVSPYASLGSQMLFMRHVIADRRLAPIHWGNMVAVTAATTAIFTVSLALIGKKLFGPGAAQLIVVLVLANCFMAQITNNASMVFQTFEQLRATATLRTIANLFRIVVIAGLFFAFHHATAFQCSLAILGSSTAAAVVAATWVKRIVGPMRLDLHRFRFHFWEGIGFSVAGSTQSVYNDVDKMMLSHYGMNFANGIYTLAYRVVDLATIPVNAIDAAALPRYFALNNESLPAVVRLARRLVPAGVLCGLAATGVTLLASPIVVRLVGHGFAETILVFRWLCWLPAIRAIHQLSGGVLTATGLQNYRTAAQFAVAGLNFGLNLMWIPHQGWRGAARSSLLSDGALAVLNTLLVLFIARRSRHQALPSVAEEQAR